MKFNNLKPEGSVTMPFLLILLVWFASLTLFGQTPSNPVIPGFNPDPSVCRVGNDFYLVTSTFEYFPGIPVYHSKDLINWRMIGHVVHDIDQINYANVSSTAGIYAPTIRYHNGIYYLITTFVGGSKSDAVEQTGNFIMTAKHPSGPWSKPHWIADAPGIDPSLFFDDDGKVYYCGNRSTPNGQYPAQKQIWIQEIDLEKFMLKGRIGILDSEPYYKKEIIGSPLAFEGPHLYKKDDTYYLLVSHGGTGMGHAVSIWKSNSPFGTWEMNPNNPILTHRGYSQSGINCTGHADLFQTQEGEWYSVFLAVRSNDNKNNVMGRETFMAPVDWSGEWPIVNPKINAGKTQLTLDPTPMYKGTQCSSNFEDEFTGNKLGMNWTFIRTPKTKWWSLTNKPGFLSIELIPAIIEDFTHPAFLGIRITEMKASFSTSLEFSPEKESECAGLAILRGHKPNWSLVKEKQGSQLKVSVYYTDSLLASTNLSSNEALDLKIDLDNFHLTFYYREPNSDWFQICEADATEMGFPPAGRFTGSFAGLYASSRGNSTIKNRAFFNSYEMKVSY